jgi:1-acyl-sn-glycerol-3-phosphate acyltransferase
MGAFVAAARSGAALVPVTIRGTRGILCDDTRLPRHGVVRVIIESPLAPRGQDWAEAKRLQAAARTAIARHLDERDLGES